MGVKYLSETLLSMLLDVYPEAELVGHLIVLIFWGIIIFLTEASLYIATSKSSVIGDFVSTWLASGCPD